MKAESVFGDGRAIKGPGADLRGLGSVLCGLCLVSNEHLVWGFVADIRVSTDHS